MKQNTAQIVLYNLYPWMNVLQLLRDAVLLRICLFIAIIIVTPCIIIAAEPHGSINGTVYNSSTRLPVNAATILISELKKGSITNVKGEFSIASLPVGTYSVRISCIGYATATYTDIIIRSGRITRLEIPLEEQSVKAQDMIVSEGYFKNVNRSGILEMSMEEIRRAPGSFGDIGRALANSPSAVQADDASNDLMIRGGTAFENGYYIDNIFTPNINHFPQMGASGGNISILNIDFIQSVQVQSGAFPASYTNRLSGFLDFKLRQGNKETTDIQADLNIAGFGGQIEGPIGNSINYMISAKRSYLDIIAGILNLNGAPRYGDAQGKLTWKINENNSLSYLNMFGISQFIRTEKEAIEKAESQYGSELYYSNTSGVNLNTVWSNSVFSSTSFSYALIDASKLWRSAQNGQIQTDYGYIQQYLTARSVWTIQALDGWTIDAGTEWQYQTLKGDSPEVRQGLADGWFDQGWGSLFLQNQIQISDAVKANAGLNITWYNRSKKTELGPRFSMNYTLNKQHSFSVAWSRIFQEIPSFLLLQQQSNYSMPPLQADHYSAGWQFLPQDDIRITAEIYFKGYKNFPVSESVPWRFPVDDVSGDEDDFDFYGNLISTGIARSYGIEIMLQKKLSDHFYGSTGITLYRSKYQDINQIWRSRASDNQIVINVIAGWKPDNEWELSMRWLYMGGRPYTPIDERASNEMGFTVFDRSRHMQGHLPAYHSLSIRVDKRWNFMHTNMITYLNITNVYNRSNPRAAYWDFNSASIRYSSQFPFLPVIGIEFEF